MAAREQRHALRSRSSRVLSVLGWIADLLVVLLVVAAFGQAQWDLGHRWFGLDQVNPLTDPGQVSAPAGLNLAAGSVAPLVASPLVPGRADAAAVRRALAPYDAASDLGQHVALEVADLSTDQVLFKRGAATVTPASTMKLLTTTSTLATLGPGARFSTKVVGSGSKIVLVGGGDPFLASSPARAKGQYPARADIATLAASTAATLARSGIRHVTVGYDTSLFTGPAVDPNWPASYLPDGVVPPISALWVDEGRVGHGQYAADPALVAAQKFVAVLRARHIAVQGAPVPGRASATDPVLAQVQSSPVGEIVQQTLAMSDNNAAEVLARHVGAVISHDPSFAGGARSTFAVLKRLGVNLAGSRAYDGSGLSRQTVLSATTLMQVVELVTSTRHPTLRQVITGLPIAGFSGSLRRRFDQGPPSARGRVQAKTGTLTGVHGLVGVAVDLDGDLLAFVLVADRAPVDNPLGTQHQLDLMAGALGACHCGLRKVSP